MEVNPVHLLRFLLLSLGWHLHVLSRLLTLGFNAVSYFRHGIWLLECFPKGQVRPLKENLVLWILGNEKWEESGRTLPFSFLHGQQGKLLFQCFRKKPFVLSKHVCPGNCSYLSWTLCEGVAITVMTPCLLLPTVSLSLHLHYPGLTCP